MNETFGTPPGTPPPPPAGFDSPPGAPPPPPEALRDGPPWEQRSGILDLGAMLATVRDVLFDAPRTFARMLREGGLGSPLIYLLILGSICGWIAQLWSLALGAATAGLMGGMGGMGGGAAAGDMGAMGLSPEMQAFMQSPVFQVIEAMLLPAFILIFYFIKAGVFHLMLLAVGGARQPFETTARTVAYADGSTAVFNILPLCGGLIAFVYGVVVTIIGLAAAHETSAGRAAAAVLLPLVLCCLCLVALVMVFAASLVGLAGGGL